MYQQVSIMAGIDLPSFVYQAFI